MQDLPNTEDRAVMMLAIAHSMVKAAGEDFEKPSQTAELRLDRLLEAFEKAYQKVYDTHASRG